MAQKPTREQILKEGATAHMNAWVANWVLDCPEIPADLHPMMLAYMLIQHIAESGSYRVSLTVESTRATGLMRSECLIVDWEQDKEIVSTLDALSFLAVYRAALLWALKL